MNERIKKLSIIAKNLATDDALYLGRIHNRTLSLDELEQIFEQKFAELIVLECADHCDLLLTHKMSPEWSRGTHDCSKAIKKHFGIEK